MAHGGQELVLELTGALSFFLGACKGFLGALLQGDIVEYDNASLKGAILTLQGPASNIEQAPLRYIGVADEELDVVDVLTTHRANQRQFICRKQGNAIRKK